MRKIHSQQDMVTNGHADISSESGDKDTGIRSQRELEEQIAQLGEERAILGPQLQDTLHKCSELEEQVANLLAANEALSNEFIRADGRYHGAAERSAHLEAKLQEISEQYQQAAVVIAQQENQIVRLKSELADYFRQVIQNQHQELVILKQDAGGGNQPVQ